MLLAFLRYPCYAVSMIIEQTVEIPDVKSQSVSVFPQSAEIENISRFLQKEMAEKGTSKVKTASGSGWEAHIKERYAECQILPRF